MKQQHKGASVSEMTSAEEAFTVIILFIVELNRKWSFDILNRVLSSIVGWKRFALVCFYLLHLQLLYGGVVRFPPEWIVLSKREEASPPLALRKQTTKTKLINSSRPKDRLLDIASNLSCAAWLTPCSLGFFLIPPLPCFILTLTTQFSWKAPLIRR